jgi:hypothetical protein
MLYTGAVRRLLLAIALGIVIMETTGLEALLFAEPCTSAADRESDGSCPPLCVRCHCCAQPMVPAVAPLVYSAPVLQAFLRVASRPVPGPVACKIFHVPKYGPAADPAC